MPRPLPDRPPNPKEEEEESLSLLSLSLTMGGENERISRGGGGRRRENLFPSSSIPTNWEEDGRSRRRRRSLIQAAGRDRGKWRDVKQKDTTLHLQLADGPAKVPKVGGR